jgi:D-alanyl-lipoteichoic acid acyltransferase DltB (MBOAT superfamily)
MLFNTPAYFGFFAITALLYWAVSHRRQNLLLLCASFLFYSWWDWRFLFLLVTSAVVDFTMALRIADAQVREDRRASKHALLVSIVANLSVLGFFKYFNFFVGSAESALRSLGYEGSLWTLHVILPVGISFYTFQTMSYTIDVYRQRITPTRRLLDFILFVCFFPQLVAGPIERASTLLRQIQRPRRLFRTDVEQGLLLFALGFFRKVAIADPAGVIADRYFAEPGMYTTVPLAAGLSLYAVQIYNDFAGYSDMARGSARLLGFELSRNFRHPYFSTSVSEFWTRWHITLSTWLRDYLYIPLGGNRRGPQRTFINLMTTMLLGGLWHGAAWTFVVWGALHGAYLAVQHAWQRAVPASWMREAGPLGHAAAAGLVFSLTTFTWLFFRSPDFETAAVYLSGLFSFTPGYEGALLPVAVLGGLTLLIDVPQALSDNEYVFLDWPVGRRAVATATASVLLLASGSANAPFIYFQF